MSIGGNPTAGLLPRWKLLPTADYAPHNYDWKEKRYKHGCRGFSCSGYHYNYPASERPKLEKIHPSDVVDRILKTPMWKGAASDGRPHHFEGKHFYLIIHPSGAEARIWCNETGGRP